jgi:epoxyqueuosine reductase
MRPGIGRHIFGCDICQDVCPWNRAAPLTSEPAFSPRHLAPALDQLADLEEAQFGELYAHSPVQRAKYAGLLRNVAIAMGNSRLAKFRAALETLAQAPNETVAEHARWALGRLDR